MRGFFDSCSAVDIYEYCTRRRFEQLDCVTALLLFRESTHVDPHDYEFSEVLYHGWHTEAQHFYDGHSSTNNRVQIM